MEDHNSAEERDLYRSGKHDEPDSDLPDQDKKGEKDSKKNHSNKQEKEQDRENNPKIP